VEEGLSGLLASLAALDMIKLLQLGFCVFEDYSYKLETICLDC